MLRASPASAAASSGAAPCSARIGAIKPQPACPQPHQRDRPQGAADPGERAEPGRAEGDQQGAGDRPLQIAAQPRGDFRIGSAGDGRQQHREGAHGGQPDEAECVEMQMEAMQGNRLLWPDRAGEYGEEGRHETGQRSVVPGQARVRPAQHPGAAAPAPDEQRAGCGRCQQRARITPPKQIGQTERAHHQRAAGQRQDGDADQSGRGGAAAGEHRDEVAHGAEDQRHGAHRKNQVQGGGASGVWRPQQGHGKRGQGNEYQRRQRHGPLSCG